MAASLEGLDAFIADFEAKNIPAGLEPTTSELEAPTSGPSLGGLDAFIASRPDLEGAPAPAPAPVASGPSLTGFDAFVRDGAQDYKALVASGDNPEADAPEAGFFSGLVGGVVNTFNSAIGVPAELINESIAAWAQEEFPNTAFAKWTAEADTAQKQRMFERSRFTRALPQTDTLANLARADSTEEFFDIFMESGEKWATFKEFVGSVIPGSLAFAGGAGYAGLAGGFATAFVLDWGDSYQESIAQGKTKEEALWAATVKGLTQAGVDTLTLSAAKIKFSTNKYKDLTMQLAIQASGGAGAEQLKHKLVGEETTVGKTLLEAGGELIGAPLDIHGIRSFEAKKQKRVDAVKALSTKIRAAADEAGFGGLKKDLLDQLDQLEKRAKLDEQEVVELDPVKVVDDEGNRARGQLLDVNTGAQDTRTSQVIETSAEVVLADGTTQYLFRVDWESHSVVAAVETHWRALAQEARVAIEKLTGYMREQEANPKEIGKGIVDGWAAEIAIWEQDLANAEDNSKRETEFTAKAVKLIEEWVSIFAPEMRVVVSSGQIGAILSQQLVGQSEIQFKGEVDVLKNDFNAIVNPTQAQLIAYNKELLVLTKKWKARISKQKSYDIKGPDNKGTGGLSYKLASGTQIIDLDAGGLYSESGFTNQADFIEVVAHEFGHALISQVFDGSSHAARNALRNGYKKWLKRLAAAKTKEEFFKIHGGAARASQNTGQEAFSNKDVYWYSMEEYLANQLAKSVEGDKLVGTVVEKFFKKAHARLKELFNSLQSSIPEQSYVDFLNYLALKRTLAAVNAAEAAGEVASQSQVVAKARETIAGIMDSSLLGSRKKPGDNDGYGSEEFRADLDKYNGVIKWGVTLLQIGKLNKHIPGLQKYIGLIKSWWNDKMAVTAMADERLQQWNDLNQKDSANLGRFMQDLTVQSYEDSTRYGPGDDVYEKLVLKHKMSEKMLALADLIEKDFDFVLTELETLQVEDAKRTYKDDKIGMDKAIEDVAKTFKDLRNKNFFPLSRFGDWFTRVIAERDIVYDGVQYKTGETIMFETFESRSDMLKRQKVFKNSKKYKFAGGKMNDTQKQFAGFPPQFLTMLKDRLELNDAQKGEFADLIHDLAPGKSFTKHMKHRKNTKGFSTDAVRSYANYFLHFGNYVSRIKYKGQMQDAINEVKASADIISKQTGDNSKRVDIQKYMEDHYEAAMNPGNELANLRAVGFLWYLGFVPKSAVVNLTQVALVTYPFLAARYGDTAAVAAIAKATKDAGKYWLNPRAMKKGQMDMIAELIRTGLLDESMATELAAASEGSLLNRITPGSLFGSEKAARAVRQAAGWGAWMFQQAEKMNRRVTALAAYDLFLQKAEQVWKDAGVAMPKSERAQAHVEAVAAARDAVESSQFEYARWNRPRFSQGKRSVLFLFWQYMQNSLFFLAHDPGRMRYVAMMFLFAGMSGLPFAEDAMDLYDYISKKLNKKYGEEFTDINIRKSAREYIKELGMNPDLIMHGASRYSFGMSALGDMVGLPIPNFDMSGSMSMGNIIPGWGELLSDRRFDQNLGRATEAAGGAVLAMPIQLMRAIADNNPDTLKRFEKAMPSFARNLSKAYRYASRGEETLPDGTIVTKFHLEDSMHNAEIGMQALGFAPSRVSDAKVPVYMTKEILQYYALRRQSFTRALDYAMRTKNSQMVAKTWKEIKRFNRSMKNLGIASMSIRAGNIKRSLKDRIKQRRMQEMGIFGGKTGFQVSREVFDAFPEEEKVP